MLPFNQKLDFSVRPTMLQLIYSHWILDDYAKTAIHPKKKKKKYIYKYYTQKHTLNVMQ